MNNTSTHTNTKTSTTILTKRSATATTTTTTSIPKQSSMSGQSKHAILIPSALNSLLHTDKQIKYHFYSLGGDFIRLASYRRFKQLFQVGGGSLVKQFVFDLSTFLKEELNDINSLRHHQLKNFLTCNKTILEKEKSMTLCDHHFGLKNWLYIIFGYMLQNYNEQEVNNCLDQLVSMYLEARSNRFSINDIRIIRDERDQFILSTFEQYLLDVPVRNDLLYNDNDDNEGVNYIILSNIKHHKRSNKNATIASNKDNNTTNRINLPKLPKIKDKSLLVKSLMHKEFYRVLLDPNHYFGKKMLDRNYSLDPQDYSLIRKELSILDGLGDLFLAQETSKLIYELICQKNHININSSTTYQLLKIMLATNTLMAKLTKAYNLYQGLDDSIINKRIAKEWLPFTILGETPPHSESSDWQSKDEIRIYEEEFLGDFFESYMAALLIEQPEVAKSFIREIYHRILMVMTETLPPDITYQTWTSNILGRNIYRKKSESIQC